jgi:ketosteroid isomerase-like protein
MSEKENVEILRHAYELWNDTKADSVRHWLDLIADDVKWRSLAAGETGMEFTRDYDNKAGVERYFADLGSQWSMNYYTVDEFIAQGDRVVMVGRCGWRNKKTGATVATPKVDILTIRDSRIVDFFELYDTAKVLAAARAPAAAAAKSRKAPQAAKRARSSKSRTRPRKRKVARRKAATPRKKR